MGLFGKTKITEAGAAAQFVLASFTRIREVWTEIVDDLTPIFRSHKVDAAVLADPFTQLEFALAGIAIELQGLRNVVGGDTATRIRAIVLNCLKSDDLGSTAQEAVEYYDRAWICAVGRHERPDFALAAALCDRLRLYATVKIGDGECYSPLFLLAIAGAVLQAEWLGYWKHVSSKYKIVP